MNTLDYGGFVARADRLLHGKLRLPTGYSLKWSGEYEFELLAIASPCGKNNSRISMLPVRS